MSEDLAVAKIRLRLSYNYSGINAEMITPASKPVHEPTYTTPISTFEMTKKKKKANNNSHDESKINNAMADMQRGLTARSAAMKWDVPRTTLQSCKKAGLKSVTRPGTPKNPYTGWGKDSLQLAYRAKSQGHTSAEKNFAG